MAIASHPATSRLLVAQLGLVTRPQLLALGWRPDVVDGAVRFGSLRVVHRGVYRMPGSAEPPAQASLAAVLRAGSGARITGAAVLAELGVDGIAADAPGIVLLPPPRRLVTDAVAWRRDRAPDHEHLMLGPLPATTAARAFVEVAHQWRQKRQLTIADHLRWRRHATGAEIVACAVRLGTRHAGARAVLGLAATGKLDQESHGERALAAALHELGIGHLVTWQVAITPLIRVDALLASRRAVLEYDGGDHHTHPRDVQRDAARDLEIGALGFHVIHLTKADLRSAATLRQRLEGELGTTLADLRAGSPDPWRFSHARSDDPAAPSSHRADGRLGMAERDRGMRTPGASAASDAYAGRSADAGRRGSTSGAT